MQIMMDYYASGDDVLQEAITGLTLQLMQESAFPSLLVQAALQRNSPL
jgi:hypothetical protein